MKKVLAVVLSLVLILALAPAIALADDPVTQSGGAPGGVSLSAVMPLDGSWTILDEVMDEGDFFSGPYTWTSAFTVKFTITDLYVVSDQFEVWDNAALVTTTPAATDWDDIPVATAFTEPPFTTDADVALASGSFSSAVIDFGPGSHSITIKDIHIPPTTAGGDPFIDGTVAFKAELAELDIDIKPWSDPNAVNRNKKGVIPVAILGTDLFDPTALNPNNLSFNFCGATVTAHDLTDPLVWADHTAPWVFDDPTPLDPNSGDEVYYTANADDIPDLVLHFYVSDMNCSEFTSASRGDVIPVELEVTYNAETVTGSDDIVIKK